MRNPVGLSYLWGVLCDKRWKWIFTKIRCYGIIQGTVLGLLMRGAVKYGKRFKRLQEWNQYRFILQTGLRTGELVGLKSKDL